jgi:hypothetical protein
MLHVITAAELLRDVVEPDRKDAIQNPNSIRHSFHFVLGLFSLRDWVFEEFSGKPSWHSGNRISQFQDYLERQCTEFAIITDIANSAKRLELSRPSRTGMISGAKCVRVYGGAGLGFGPLV